MQDKELLEVDIRIAKLRDKIAAGIGDLNDGQEIDRLMERRIELLHAMAVTLGDRQKTAERETL